MSSGAVGEVFDLIGGSSGENGMELIIFDIYKYVNEQRRIIFQL